MSYNIMVGFKAITRFGLVLAIAFYYWLKAEKMDAQALLFIISLMFPAGGPDDRTSSSGQIMFVDYMPFLCLVLIGVDRYFEKEKRSFYS